MIKFAEGQEKKLQLIVNGRKIPAIFDKKGERLWVSFAYNKDLLGEIKAMDGARWHGYDEPVPIKKWSIKDSPRNQFQLAYLSGLNPYAPYDKPLIEFKPTRNLYSHQNEITSFGLTRHYCVIAGEMGVGKSLSAIEIIEASGVEDVWWVAPKSALNSTILELEKWKCKIKPELLTYDGLKKVLENWTEGQPPPQMVIFDEGQRIKTPTAQRSQAARFLADAIRTCWGDQGYVIIMSGSPAPKSPQDWWHICEVACPGYLKEGTIQKFVQRLAVTEKVDNGGGFYNQILGWRDSEKRCDKCGQMADHSDHTLSPANVHYHAFEPSVNEVAYLYERMKGLVLVKLKKDCLDLPEKVYRLIKLKPNINTINAAKLIKTQYPSAAQCLIRLRELSDGFQYREEKTGTVPCDACGRTGKIGDDPCVSCGGRGETDTFQTTWTPLDTPKEAALEDLLDEHSDIGRLVVYGAFTASIDRIVETCLKHQWNVIRVDGRGWKWFGEGNLDDIEMLKLFQRQETNSPLWVNHDTNICFVGHPGSAGMGLTLTASPTIVYFSNDFNAEYRIQSEDRIHRPGMDVNRGATIIDLIHLPTDKLVLDNLKKKRELQSITLGELQECLNG